MQQSQRVTPVLRIFDLSKAKEFYIDFLDFNIDWSHQFDENFPIYLQLSKDGYMIHLSEHHGDVTPGSYLRIWTEDLEAFSNTLTEKEYKYAKPTIEQTAWDTLELSIVDPFANRLTFWKDQ